MELDWREPTMRTHTRLRSILVPSQGQNRASREPIILKSARWTRHQTQEPFHHPRVSPVDEAPDPGNAT